MKLPILILYIFLCFSCGRKEKTEENASSKIQYDTVDLGNVLKLNDQKIANAFAKMKARKIELKRIGNCDEKPNIPLNGDNYIPFAKHKKISDSTLFVDFYFENACCQTFYGDYYIKNDSLIFEYQNAGDLICKCQCWYHYELNIKDVKEKFKYYKLIQKQ